MTRNLQDIQDKYLNDVSYVKDHVQYLEEIFIALLRMTGNLELASPTFSTCSMIKNLCDNNAVIKGEFSAYLDCLSIEMQALNIVDKQTDEPSGEDPTPEGDIIFYLLTLIGKGERDAETLFENAKLQIEAMCITKGDLTGGEDYHALYDNPNRIRRLVDIALEEINRRKRNGLSAEVDNMRTAIKSLDLFDYQNPINVYKQNFIQIMAYFDSCIFDMVSFCMDQAFFKWLLRFDNANIKTYDMAACNDYNTFKKNHIESSLKKCYVKDLLKIIHDSFNGVFGTGVNDIYPALQEMIGRRNVHIHHNGVADKMYIDQFNLFGATEGDYLTISKEYLAQTVAVTTQAVSAIAASCG